MSGEHDEPDVVPGFRDLDLKLGVRDDLGDLADNAAGGDDLIAAAELAQQLAMLLRLPLLGTDEQEPENDEDQDHGADEKKASCHSDFVDAEEAKRLQTDG